MWKRCWQNGKQCRPRSDCSISPGLSVQKTLNHYGIYTTWHLLQKQNNLSRLMTKPTKWHVCPAKTQISLGIRPVWSASSLFAWRKLGFLATHWAYSEDSDQTGRMPRLFWVFVWRTVILLVLSWAGSNQFPYFTSSRLNLLKANKKFPECNMYTLYQGLSNCFQ